MEGGLEGGGSHFKSALFQLFSCAYDNIHLLQQCTSQEYENQMSRMGVHEAAQHNVILLESVLGIIFQDYKMA